MEEGGLSTRTYKQNLEIQKCGLTQSCGKQVMSLLIRQMSKPLYQSGYSIEVRFDVVIAFHLQAVTGLPPSLHS